MILYILHLFQQQANTELASLREDISTFKKERKHQQTRIADLKGALRASISHGKV